jgi:hypothetical protein
MPWRSVGKGGRLSANGMADRWNSELRLGRSRRSLSTTAVEIGIGDISVEDSLERIAGFTLFGLAPLPKGSANNNQGSPDTSNNGPSVPIM